MKKLTFLSSIFIIFISFLLLNTNVQKDPLKLITPVVKAENVLGINQWLPGSIQGQFDTLVITAKASLFVDSKSGEVLYAKNIHQKMPVASLVKVMTVLIALEHHDMDSLFTISQSAASMEPDKMFLIPSETLTLKELLYGIFLVSANDAAESIAEGTTGDRQEFIKLMNDKAKQLGMNNTYFANPTGLDEEINNSYSTVYDLVILTRYLIRRFPQVVNISSSDHIYLPKTETHQDYDMYSGINLLTTYPGVVGFKTGYTPQAGLTLITLARKGNKEIIGVLLGSDNRRDEARDLLDYSLGKQKSKKHLSEPLQDGI